MKEVWRVTFNDISVMEEYHHDYPVDEFTVIVNHDSGIVSINNLDGRKTVAIYKDWVRVTKVVKK